jgi:hypothetical protein
VRHAPDQAPGLNSYVETAFQIDSKRLHILNYYTILAKYHPLLLAAHRNHHKDIVAVLCVAGVRSQAQDSRYEYLKYFTQKFKIYKVTMIAHKHGPNTINIHSQTQHGEQRVK